MKKKFFITMIFLILIVFEKNLYSQSPLVRFAAIGDYGWDERNTAPPNDSGALKVANLVKGWQTDTNYFIITLGDNNYDNGDIETIDNNVGRFYVDYIQPRNGYHIYTYNGPISAYNRFFPAMGNHEFYNYIYPGYTRGTPYYLYFGIVSNSNNGTGAERYYDFIKGNIHFFVVNSGLADDDTCAYCEPDGFTNNSTQAQWIKARLEESTSRWNILYLHHPPFDSEHNLYISLRWDFRKWGTTVIMAGHSHVYERLIVDSLTYTVNGLGGRNITGNTITQLQDTSKALYLSKYGAQLLESYDDSLVVKFISIDNVVRDYFVILPKKILKLTNLIEGFYNVGSNTMVSDTVRTYLRNSSSPYSIIDSTKGLLNTSGVGNFKFTKTNNGTAFYLVVKHRNSIETWSKSGIKFIADTTAYNFTLDSAKAYGDNMKKKGSKWCIFSGDVDQDGSVDVTDYLTIYNDQGNSGYVVTDITGDDYVDTEDVIIAYNNSSNFVAKITP